MFNNKKLQFCLIILLTLMFVGVGSVFGGEPSESEFLMNGEYWLANAETPIYGADQPGLFAQEQVREEALYFAEAKKTEESEEKPVSPECAEFAKDPDADIGDIIRAGCQPTLAQMSALMDNPLGNVAMLFTQIDVYDMENPATDERATKSVYMGIAQFPKKLTPNWNLISRVVWSVPSMPLDQDKIDAAAGAPDPYGEAPGVTLPPVDSQPLPIKIFDGRTTGFGDIYYNGLFAPSKGKKFEGGGTFLWGAGFDAGFPTASEDILGTGKWTAGPSALAVYMGPKWKIGGLVQQYWDYAGDDDRDPVNLMNFQYFIFYSLDEVTAIGAAPNIIANWEQPSDDRWTVPIGLGISRTVQFGKVPVRFGLELHYSVIQPDNVPGSKWDLRFYVIPAAPSALFKWMN
jgi:hypothetical protein